jgi:GR25 family glycosyltransferase involved in LPS biosynthesis
MPNKDVTFIIPIFNLNEDRIENLKFILSFLLKTNKKIILAEQTNFVKSNIVDHLTNVVTEQYRDNFKHELYFHSSSLIHKTGIINWAVKNFVETRYAWVSDVDFYMKFESVLNTNWNENFIKPYSFAKKLSKEDSEKIKTKNSITVSFSDNKANYLSLYSALSFIFDKKVFLETGGMNESIFGWGQEDVEFNNRLATIGFAIQKLDYKGIHLWHTTNVPTPLIEQKNKIEKNITDKINNFFDKIYCINLNSRKEKWENVEKQFKKHNLNVTRFEAVNGNNLPKNNILLQGELGCLHSHLEIFKEAKKNNFKKILIFEDDICFSNDFLQKIECINNISWKILYLGASQHDWSDIKFEKEFYFCKNTLGTFAYAINTESCNINDILIEEFSKENAPADRVLAKIQERYYGDCYTVYPNIVIADVRESDIRPSQNLSIYGQQVKWDLSQFSILDFNAKTNFLAPKAKVKKILLVPDARNWAFDNIAKAIIKYNPYPEKIKYDIIYARDLYLNETTIIPTDWDFIYIMFEGETIIPPAKNIIRGCYSAFWLENQSYTPEYMANYFSQCAGAIFVNNALKDRFLRYLPENFPVKVITDASDDNLFYPIKYKKNKTFTVLFVGNTARPIKNYNKIVEICRNAEVDLHVCKNIPNEKMVIEYNKADIVINYSEFEGGPQTFIEAAMCEVPMLIRDTNQLAKLIPCFLGKNENDFVEILNYLKNNREECVKKGKDAYDVVIKDFTYKKTSQIFSDFCLSFVKKSLEEKLTVFIVNAGENPNYKDCINAINNQNCTFQIKFIENIAPMSKAFQKMIDDCETEYYIQVDGDMILNTNAIETIYNTLVTSDSKISIVAYMLKDAHLNYNIYGVKGYKHNLLKKYPYNLEIISCEVEQIKRMQNDGYETLMLETVLGLHSPFWTPELIYERYFDLMEKWKVYKYHWMSKLPVKLLEIFKKDPSNINFFALAGAINSLSSELPLRNREKNFTIKDPAVENLKKMYL